MLCHLKVIDGPARGAQLLLGSNQRVSIGRISTADFSIAADQHLSRNHLVVEGVGDSFRVTDAGSSNGTFVNNTLISSVLLCSGDIIRAGKSLFQVQLKKATESNGSEAPSPFQAEVASEVPSRTISAEIASDRPTEFYSLQANPAATVQHDHGETSNVATSDDTTLCSPLEGRYELMLLKTHFSVEDPSELLWMQKTDPSAQLQENILRSLTKLPYNFNVILNRRQVDASTLNSLLFQLTANELANLTETLSVVYTKREKHMQALCKACAGKDAMILVASQEPLSTKWIEQSLDAVSYPSLLWNVVQESTSRAKSLIKGVEFILFESSPHGHLCLLPNSDLRDKMHLFNVTGN